MARLLINASMIRFPMGGMNHWILTWLLGFKHFGHEVFLVENSGWENACFDLKQGIMTDDCSYGRSVVEPLLKRYGLENNWSYIDHNGTYHGMQRPQVDELVKNADVFIDFEWGDFFERASDIPLRIFLDGEPGWFQIKLARMLKDGYQLRHYDYYYTDGLNIGTDSSSAPNLGIDWRHVITPTRLDNEPTPIDNHNGRFTTIMAWQSHKPVEFEGNTYGQKDIEFEKFMELPTKVDAEFEVAVSGQSVPKERLKQNHWRVRQANSITHSVESYLHYIKQSKGEFSVAKNAFVQTQCGWFGDRAGVYLSYGKPVVLQDTGCSKHIECGRGLFAVHDMQGAIQAMNEIEADYPAHCRAAREIAEQYLNLNNTIGRFLREIGL